MLPLFLFPKPCFGEQSGKHGLPDRKAQARLAHSMSRARGGPRSVVAQECMWDATESVSPEGDEGEYEYE